MDFRRKRLAERGAKSNLRAPRTVSPRANGEAIKRCVAACSGMTMLNPTRPAAAPQRPLGPAAVVLVNSAGIGSGRPIEKSDEAMWDAHVDVDLKACSSVAVPRYLHCASRRATSSNIASDAGSDGVPGNHRLLPSKGPGRQHDPRHGVGSGAGRAGQLHLPGLYRYRHDSALRPYRQERRPRSSEVYRYASARGHGVYRPRRMRSTRNGD